MPIYEFYCKKCNMLFNFFSSTINTEKRPLCPKCGKIRLERQMSLFSRVKNRGEGEEPPMPDMDESKMEQAMGLLAKEAESMARPLSGDFCKWSPAELLQPQASEFHRFLPE